MTNKMNRLMVQMPPTFHNDVKRIANEMGLSVSDVVQIAVGHWSVCVDGETALRQKIADRVLGDLVEQPTGPTAEPDLSGVTGARHA